MDSPLQENRSNILVYALLIAAVIALALGIISLKKISTLSNQLGTVTDLNTRLDQVDQKATDAKNTAGIANSPNNQALRDLATRMQREIGNEFAAVRGDISRIDTTVKTATDKVAELESRGGVRSSGGGAVVTTTNGGTPGQLAEDGTYVIKSGDTLGAIGRQFGVSWQEIQRSNPGLEANRLRPGTKIVIPKAP